MTELCCLDGVVCAPCCPGRRHDDGHPTAGNSQNFSIECYPYEFAFCGRLRQLSQFLDPNSKPILVYSALGPTLVSFHPAHPGQAVPPPAPVLEPQRGETR